MDFHKTKLFAESWNIAFRKRTDLDFPENLTSPFSIINNSFRYWAADPFLFEEDGEAYIFAELYDYLKKRGVIGFCRINDIDKKWTPIIQEPYHLSFPFLYREAGNIYLMPESSQSGQLYRYRAVHFPDHWEKDTVFFSDVRYVDTTPFTFRGERLALTYDLSNQSLRILNFTDGADSLADTSSPEMKRPAGFINAQMCVRAAQNCQMDYGKGLIFYRFTVGEDLSFQEEEICRVMPENLTLSESIYRDGLHTYQRSEHYEVIDIKTRRINVLNLAIRILSKIHR